MKKSYRAIGVVAAVALAATGLVAGTSAAQAATKVLTISTDLPLQGSSFDSNDSTNKAIALYLKQVKYKAGKYTVKLKLYDNATAAKGSWDDAKCAANAQAHVANKSEVAVMGTYNSGCAKIIVPILNQAPGGAMTMISNANTNPGLTKSWNPGEPDIYYPTGVRNYGRVCTTDDVQGSAAAQFAKSVGIKSVYVLNDTQTYGQGVAQAFTTEAKKQGMTVLSSGAYGEGWDAKQTDYTALFTKIKALNPDMVYVGGIFDNNGGQLVKDKVAVLGDNTKVKLMGPDGFTGYPDLNKMPEADGMYLSFAGLSSDLLMKIDPKGAGAKFVTSYKKAYGKEPVGSYPVYGVAAVQVILAAIAKSNGTRKGVTNAIFSGSGITIPAKKSVLGKALTISTLTGDTLAKDVTIEVIKGGEETTLKAQTVK
ncbi:MAG: branched-chain amino acid ABC transporter substrate-binding protein [Actinobacteria bacterium]|nr:branched-chain amino acid ABC transporter substrate-binding protein [Actinomycetota bacterium]